MNRMNVVKKTENEIINIEFNIITKNYDYESIKNS